MSAVAGGVDLKIILGQANNLNFIIAAQPEIKRIQDIAGKKVGVSRTGSSTWIGLMMALEHYRLDPSKEQIKSDPKSGQNNTESKRSLPMKDQIRKPKLFDL